MIRKYITSIFIIFCIFCIFSPPSHSETLTLKCERFATSSRPAARNYFERSQKVADVTFTFDFTSNKVYDSELEEWIPIYSYDDNFILIRNNYNPCTYVREICMREEIDRVTGKYINDIKYNYTQYDPIYSFLQGQCHEVDYTLPK